MSTIRKVRAEKREAQENPINVTILMPDRTRKVIPYEEYERNYLNPKKEE